MASKKLTEICLQRGIIYPDAEIYEEMSGFYDYGSIGTKILKKWKDEWRKFFLTKDNFHEITTTNIMPEPVFRASGHLSHFMDPVVECSKCGNKERADQILEQELDENFEGKTPEELTKIIEEHNIKCSSCGGKLKEVGNFNLMFSVDVGSNKQHKAYLRPETAQGPFTAFKREYRANRKQLPLGLAVIGRAYRNEINPRKQVLRTREFNQAELQIFFDKKHLNDRQAFPEIEFKVKPVDSKEQTATPQELVNSLNLPEKYIYWMAKEVKFMKKLGLEDIRFRELSDEEKSFYNKHHWDLEAFMPGFNDYEEIAAVHYRTNRDLKLHAEESGQNLTIASGDYYPHVIEVTFGIDRNVYALLDNALRSEDDRTWLSLDPLVAPYDVAVFPLIRKKDLPKKAKRVKKMLEKKGFSVTYDSKDSIGRRYARTDEIGVPFAITIDFDTLEDDSVTIRERDSTKQIREDVKDLPKILRRLKHEKNLEEVGEVI